MGLYVLCLIFVTGASLNGKVDEESQRRRSSKLATQTVYVHTPTTFSQSLYKVASHPPT
jgi:hypothetical protein